MKQMNNLENITQIQTVLEIGGNKYNLKKVEIKIIVYMQGIAIKLV